MASVQRIAHLRLARSLPDERAEVEDVATHRTQELVGPGLDPGTAGADLVAAVEIARVAGVALGDQRREDRMDEVVRGVRSPSPCSKARSPGSRNFCTVRPVARSTSTTPRSPARKSAENT
jgi:hypothetical protein